MPTSSLQPQPSSPASNEREPEALFLQNLGTIRRILGVLARRHAMELHDAEDFASWATARVMDDDYAIIRKFGGRCAIATYLSVVLAMLFKEYRVTQWGRWRTSAVARRSGRVGIRLEMLVERDGWPLSQAGQVLRTAGATRLSDGALSKLASRFPRRLPLRPVVVGDTSVDAPSPVRSDELVEVEERLTHLNAIRAALRSALDSLDADERLIVRMHFVDSMSIADIARGLALPQKPLYRRLERALAALRKQLETVGVSREQVRAVINWNCS